MIEETATVIRQDGDFAWVSIERQTACGQCAAQKGCGTSVLSGWFNKRMSNLRVQNTIHARAGEQVVVGVEENVLVKSAFIVYMLPLVFMGLGALIGYLLEQQVFDTRNDLIVILSSVAGLAVSFIFLRMFYQRTANRTEYQPVLLRRVTPVRFTGGQTVTISQEF